MYVDPNINPNLMYLTVSTSLSLVTLNENKHCVNLNLTHPYLDSNIQDICRFAPKACPPFSAVETTPYAELWMGTHPNGDILCAHDTVMMTEKFSQRFSGPARLAQTGQLLGDLLAANPELLGEESRAKFGDKLPFLFKVQS